MNWILKIFKPPFRLPERGDKVVPKGDRDKNRRVYEVMFATGTEKDNRVYLMCHTVFYTGEWELVNKKTPTRY